MRNRREMVTVILVMVTAQSRRHLSTPPSAIIGLSTGGDITARLEMPSTGELSLESLAHFQ